MNRKAVLAITLTLMLTSMLTLAFNIHSARAELTDRKVGVSVGYWIQYGISVTWESNDPNATTPQYVLDSQQLVFLSSVVQSVSGTNVTFNRIMLFKNGTEKSETRWIDVDSGHAGTGSSSGYLSFIAANLSAGDIIYTGLGKGIGEINETITRTYLGEPVEINHHNSTTSGTSYFIYADAYWNRATGALYEMYMNHTDYTTKGEETYVTQETQWLYPIGIIGVAKTWTVNDDGPADFLKIQDAINAANPEDTIFVHSGTYYENVIVNKTVSLVGENRSTTVIDAKGKGTVVVVTAEAANIQDFTVQNSGISLGDSGIVLSKSMSNIVKGNIISNNGLGIYVVLSNNNTFYHNVLVNNWEGMRFLLSSLNIVNGNVIKDNHYGIQLVDSGNNVLRNNSMIENVYNFGVAGDELPHFINDVDASNTVDGKAIYYLINKQHLVVKPSAFPDAGYLAVINSTRITVEDFCFFNNFQGVLFAYTNNSKIDNLNVSDNFHGIMLFGSNNTLKRNNLTKNVYAIDSYGHSNLYFENVIADNNDGIWLIGSNNSIRRNTIANNNYRGIYLIGSNNTVFQNEIMNNSVGIVIDFYDNKIYHNNFINNVKQADLNEPRAIGIWDGGYLSGGNYWSDYAGVDLYSGPHQNETGSDGIGDTPYFIDEDNQDNYPLMEPWSLEPSSPVEATHELVEKIETWNLPKGTRKSLAAKLKVAIHMLDLGKEDGAIRKLTAFINRVEMLREKTLTNEQADELVLEAQRIIDLIEG